MRSEYYISYQEKNVGKVTIIPQGLYYYISACCTLKPDHFYELILSSKGIRQSLGVLLPQNGEFTLVKKIPSKCFIENELTFSVALREPESAGDFVSVENNAPFAYIQRLEHAVLSRKGETVGVLFSK